MRDVNQLLKQKEAEIDRIKREVEALRAVAPLLGDEAETATKMPPRSAHDSNAPDTVSMSQLLVQSLSAK